MTSKKTKEIIPELKELSLDELSEEEVEEYENGNEQIEMVGENFSVTLEIANIISQHAKCRNDIINIISDVVSILNIGYKELGYPLFAFKSK